MTPLTDVIEGLRVTLAGIGGLNVYDHVPGTVIFPAAVIIPPTIALENLDDGGYMAVFEVPILVGSAVAENQRTLIPFLDPDNTDSLFQTVKADRQLGGLDVDARVTGAPRRVTFDEMAAYKAWGQIVQITVFVS